MSGYDYRYKCIGTFTEGENFNTPEIDKCRESGHIFETEKISNWETEWICRKCKIYFYIKRRY